MKNFSGIFFLVLAFVAAPVCAQTPIPADKPVKPKALLVRPASKPSGTGNFTMVNKKYVFSPGSIQSGSKTGGILVPPSLPTSKVKTVTPPQMIGGVITPGQKPLIIHADKVERIKPSRNFEDSVISRYSDDTENRMAGGRGKVLEVQSLPAQPHVRIHETNDSSPFVTASLPKAGRVSEGEPVIIFFKEHSPDLEVGQIEIINSDIVNILRRNPNRKVSVYGYAEAGGGGKSIDELSQSRALLISEYLVNKGIDASRIEARGMGSDTPISPKNRVDVVLYN